MRTEHKDAVQVLSGTHDCWRVPLAWGRVPAVGAEVGEASAVPTGRHWVWQECCMPVTEVAAQSWPTLTCTLRRSALFRKVHYITCSSGLHSALLMHVFCKMHFNQQTDFEQDIASPSPSLALADPSGVRRPSTRAPGGPR